MKEFLSSFRRRFFKSLGLCTALIAVNFALYGKLPLMGAVVIGEVLAAVFGWNMASRLQRCGSMPKEAGKRAFYWGFALRFVLLGSVLLVSVKLSTAVFGACVLGFIVTYGLMLISLIQTNYEKNSKDLF